MTATMRRRGTAIAGTAAFTLSVLGLSSPVGAIEAPRLEDCLGAPLPLFATIYVPDNSTGWTNGTPGNDVIIGTDGPELINGEGGADTICGNDGEDWILGDRGHDDLYGGDEDDFISGSTGDDEIFGEDGDDAIIGDGGDDDLDCGDDTDYGSGDEGTDQQSGCETWHEDPVTTVE